MTSQVLVMLILVAVLAVLVIATGLIRSVWAFVAQFLLLLMICSWLLVAG